MNCELLLIGGKGGTNVGESLSKAASQLDHSHQFLDHGQAYQAPRWLRKLNWYFCERRPTRLFEFSQTVLAVCVSSPPRYLITTGLSPVNAEALNKIGSLGVIRFNFLTDDPWNKEHYAPWFMKTLLSYDVVFTPRRSNINDLFMLGCKNVAYLPFGYDPDYFYAAAEAHKEEQAVELIFVGGADSDRVPYIAALQQTGIRIALYGSYWERFKETRQLTLGQAGPGEIRRATAAAKIALCLVRRANRDGHVMRSFEIPAIGTCMLAEDTAEHREIFGEEGQATLYFLTIPEMLQKARWLLEHQPERERMARVAHRLITTGRHTYCDRLSTMLDLAKANQCDSR
ncbi:MAG: glycosyltransferase [Acidobacteria bacterium]|nr:glycosyltransferase [Acidobacteriota bacterium]MBI3425576.1 glycosyltransferase [Acidobacteriota bacterium]